MLRRIIEKFLLFRRERFHTDVRDWVREELLSQSELYRLLLQNRNFPSLISSVFTQVIRTKQELIDLVNTYKDSFFHIAVVDMLADDVLSADPVSNEVVQLSSKNEEVDEIVKELQDRIDLDNFISSIVDDVIAYGDYVVAVIHDGKKVLSLEDTIDQRNVIVLYSGGVPQFLVKFDDGYFGVRKGEVKEYIDFIHFCIPGKKVRVKLDWKPSGGSSEITSNYVKVGRPLFWGVWDLLSSLYMLLVFYPIFAVQKLNASTIVGVRIPKEVPPGKAYEIARKYQELLNVSIGVDRYGRVTVSDVLDTVGKYKVVPIYSEDEKGLLQLNDPRIEEAYMLEVVEELKKVICASIGVPYQLLFGSAEGMSRLDTLKAFNRYVKKVARIQSAIRNGLTQLAVIECKLRGLNVSPNLIDVRFRNNIISVEHLDRLEFLAGMIETVNNAVDIVTSLSEKVKAKVDIERLVSFVNEYFAMAGLVNVLQYTEQESSFGSDFGSGIEEEELSFEEPLVTETEEQDKEEEIISFR